MHKLRINNFSRFIKISDFKESPFNFSDLGFFRSYTRQDEDSFIQFYRFVMKYMHPETVRYIFENVTMKHLKDYLKTYNFEDNIKESSDSKSNSNSESSSSSSSDSEEEERRESRGKWFKRKELITLISKFPDALIPLLTNYRDIMLEIFPNWLMKKIDVNNPEEMEVLIEVEDNFPDIVVGKIEDCSIKEFKEQTEISPFPDMNQNFRKILKAGVNIPKYEPFRDKRRVSYIFPGNLTSGLLTFYTSKILYYSIKMEKSLSIAKRNGKVPRWKYLFPRVSSQYNQWEAKKQIFPGKFIDVRKKGANLKNLVGILCFKDDDSFYQWGSKVRLDSIRIYNMKTRRVIKTIEVHHFFNDEWYFGNCKFSIDFNSQGNLFFRIFHRDGYHVLNLSEPQKHILRSKPYRLFEIAKFESIPFTYKEIISSSSTESRFSIHFKKNNKDYVFIYKPRVTGELPRGSSICLDPSDLRQRLMTHFLLFNMFILLIFREEIHLVDFKKGKRIIYQLPKISEFFKDKKGFKNLKREYFLDYNFRKIYFRIGYKYHGVVQLEKIFNDIFERYPGLKK